MTLQRDVAEFARIRTTWADSANLNSGEFSYETQSSLVVISKTSRAGTDSPPGLPFRAHEAPEPQISTIHPPKIRTSP